MARQPRNKKPDEAVLEGEALDPAAFQIVGANTIWSCDDTGFDLSLEQALFARSYMIDRNPVAALRRLHYDGPADVLKRRAAKYLADSNVQGAVEVLGKRMMEKINVTAEKIQRRLAAVAFFNPREVMQFDGTGLVLLNSRYWTDDQIAAVQSVEMGKEGIKVRLYDSLRATEMLAKQLSMLPDETADAAAAAAKAAATAAVDRIMEIFDRTHPAPELLPAPDEAEDTKH